MNHILTLTILCLSLCFTTLCLKQDYSQTFNGVSSIFLGETGFGLSNQGVIQINYNVVASKSGSASASLLLIIINSGQLTGYYKDLNSGNAMCNSPSLYRQFIYGSGNISYTTVTGPDQFNVIVMQCINGNPKNPTKSSFSVSMYSPDPKGASAPVHYLSADQITLVTFLEGLLISYCILLFFLGTQIYYA